MNTAPDVTATSSDLDSSIRVAEPPFERRPAELEGLRRSVDDENAALCNALRTTSSDPGFVGASAAFQRVVREARLVARTDATVLIAGESGVGKELVANLIHGASDRHDGLFVKVNCAAMSAGLIESELFGHVKGAFTGATRDRPGRFELAHRGTLLLDEVGELPLETQAKLLRVLQEREVERVGCSRTRHVDVRLVSATNRDLAEMVRRGEFREDLFYRLNVFPIRVPPLRERREDIPLIVTRFLRVLSHRLGRELARLDEPSLERLLRHAWPGNVRELQNVLERATILSRGPVVVVDEDALATCSTTSSEPAAPQFDGTLEEVERRYIVHVLQQTRWRVAGRAGAARRLGLNPSTLRSRMAKLGIRRPRETVRAAS